MRMDVKVRRNATGSRRWILAGLTFVLVVFLITTVFGKKGFLEIRRIRRSHQALLLEKERLLEEKKKLEQDILRLKQDPEAVELQAREKLWLMRPDEIVLVDPKR